MSRSILRLAVLVLLVMVPGSGYAATASPAPVRVDDATALDQFFATPVVTLTLQPSQYLSALGQVIVPYTLANGNKLRLEIPWDDPTTLAGNPTVVIRPVELTPMAGRLDQSSDVAALSWPYGAFVADQSRPTVCGNRKTVGDGFVQNADGSLVEAEIGFIWAPTATDAAVAAAAAGDGCPLLASRNDCQTHKDCAVSIGIPPITITINGKCYPGPWPLGSLCRCWLLAPDKAVDPVVVE